MSESEKTHLSLLEHPPAKSPPKLNEKNPLFRLLVRKYQSLSPIIIHNKTLYYI